ncbi:unnamed protein product [Orchesella dallaii]|uniref:Glutamyl-tRNA(Gln) amidotransferase subunit C, mitochondrial n=1 Tax=Orchesella dallaii TaxID=48710 RepID=A0ABP1S2H4_9HEXA
MSNFYKGYVSVIKTFNVSNFMKVRRKSMHLKIWEIGTKSLSLSCCNNGTNSHRSFHFANEFSLNGNSSYSFHSSCQKSGDKGESDKCIPPEKLSENLVHHLERTSLVDFDNAEAVARLSEAIRFADQLFEVNTEGVEPLVTVLENEALYLREDVAEQTNRKEVLNNASVTEEDYFVAPPGNIPLEPTSKQFLTNEESVS